MAMPTRIRTLRRLNENAKPELSPGSLAVKSPGAYGWILLLRAQISFDSYWVGHYVDKVTPGRLKMAMDRVTEYRGFDIHVDLHMSAKDMFDVWFQVEGPMRPPGVAAFGKRIKVFGGPYSRRWAYLVAELAGRAAVDVVLGPDE